MGSETSKPSSAMKKSEQEERKPLIDPNNNGEFVHISAKGEDSVPLDPNPPRNEGDILDIEEILYSMNSFMAVLKPVSVTMLLASLATVYVQNDATNQNNGLSAYEIYDTSSGSGTSASVRLGESILNSLVIVCVLAAATFGMVLLYKFRCMKCLVGYMMFSSVMLLGAMGGMVLWTLLDKWQVPMDQYTFFLVLYNFGVVGVISIFYQKGVPMGITQSYLVMTSIIMAWQLSRFEEWTGWSLLVVLAFYDLCAVLTPCGPLKALVNLMQEYQEPMPGLLYEAELPATPQLEGSQRKQLQRQGSQENMETGRQQTPSSYPSPQPHPQHELQARVVDEEYDEDEDRSIKLGLGDFVFYSVLVSKAALYGFTTCAACFLVILSGLGGTLILLSIYKMALPALPISIFLGVTFYLLTRIVILPYVEMLGSVPVYL
mmetsp:Transcript_28460/g.36942  ORF Transcript_28460/g.36942 Transcript_28460/m.36942 type:complete len:432 (+) Transcript_28460:180-1475(+)